MSNTDKSSDDKIINEDNKWDSYFSKEDIDITIDKPFLQEIIDHRIREIPDIISKKNRHLILVTKPIGINTVGSSLRNACHDLRGNPSCPKIVVSPWLQSSIEPDMNIKELS